MTTHVYKMLLLCHRSNAYYVVLSAYLQSDYVHIVRLQVVTFTKLFLLSVETPFLCLWC